MRKADLLKMILDLQERVSKLEKENGHNRQQLWPQQPIFQPFMGTPVDLCAHEYPVPWNSVLPAPCKKCGKASPSYTITCLEGTSGNVQVANIQSVKSNVKG